MSSRGSHDGHLDADAGREVVYCHNCSNEWYRDENGLTCPYCRSDVTEIVSPENDPREMDNASDSTSPGIPPLRFADDSDPDEADIEEHMGPHGFHFRQSTRAGADERHHDPFMSLISHRYQDLIQGLEPPRPVDNRPLFPPSNPAPFGPPRIQRTTFTSGTAGGGTASVTIFSTPDFGSRGVGGSGSGSGRGDGQDPSNRGNMDPFQAFFSSVIRDMAPPDETGEPGPQLGLFRSLQEILNHFSPGNAMMGDAVYSQEALDRIITQLMENHSQSNAPPGVSEEAIAKLKRRTVDKEFLEPDGKAECSICLDVMDADQEDTYVDKVITYLPCKHWFHDECAVPWLKEHNSCPVCRTPIEKNERDGEENNRRESSAGGSGASGPSNSGLHAHSPPPPASASRSNSDQSRGFGSRPDNGADTPMGRAAADMVSSVNIDSQPRPSNPSQSRLNEALRSVASIQRERDYDRRDRGTTSGVSYDTSRLQRRTSHSPSSPRATNLAEQGSRMRQRSPSEGDRRGSGDRETRRQSGALSWLRDRFTGGGASGSGGN